MIKRGGETVGATYAPDVEPLTDIYLKSKLEFDFPVKGNIMHVRILAFVAFGLLFIAIINFINLSTAQSLSRAKEVSVRKVMGSGRRSVIFQFLIESTLMATLAMLFALLFFSQLLPTFTAFTGKSLSISSF